MEHLINSLSSVPCLSVYWSGLRLWQPCWDVSAPPCQECCKAPAEIQGKNRQQQHTIYSKDLHQAQCSEASPLLWDNLFQSCGFQSCWFHNPPVNSEVSFWQFLPVSPPVDFTSKQSRKERPEDHNVPAALADFIHQQRTQEHVEDMWDISLCLMNRFYSSCFFIC